VLLLVGEKVSVGCSNEKIDTILLHTS